jgi:hypothetical protein
VDLFAERLMWLLLTPPLRRYRGRCWRQHSAGAVPANSKVEKLVKLLEHPVLGRWLPPEPALRRLRAHAAIVNPAADSQSCAGGRLARPSPVDPAQLCSGRTGLTSWCQGRQQSHDD